MCYIAMLDYDYSPVLPSVLVPLSALLSVLLRVSVLPSAPLSVWVLLLVSVLLLPSLFRFFPALFLPLFRSFPSLYGK